MKFKISQTTNQLLVMELHKECFPTDEWYDHEKNTYWIAYERGRAVGFAMATDYGNGILFLSRCGVLHSFRGRGLQRRFISVRLAMARRKGTRKVITYTARDNLASSNSLISSGFKLYEPEYQYAGGDYLYWLKELKPKNPTY